MLLLDVWDEKAAVLERRLTFAVAKVRRQRLARRNFLFWRL